MATQVEEYQARVRNKAVVAVYAILRGSNGKILLMLRDGTGYQDGNYDLSSGHLEEGEMPEDAVKRELKEETGVDAQKVELVHVSYRPKHDQTGDRVDFYFLVDEWEGQPQIMEPDKCKGLVWRYASGADSPFALPKNMVPHVRIALLEWARAKDSLTCSFLDQRWLKEKGLWKLD